MAIDTRLFSGQGLVAVNDGVRFTKMTDQERGSNSPINRRDDRCDAVLRCLPLKFTSADAAKVMQENYSTPNDFIRTARKINKVFSTDKKEGSFIVHINMTHSDYPAWKEA